MNHLHPAVGVGRTSEPAGVSFAVSESISAAVYLCRKQGWPRCASERGLFDVCVFLLCCSFFERDDCNLGGTTARVIESQQNVF